jgi:hypothetical protein
MMSPIVLLAFTIGLSSTPSHAFKTLTQAWSVEDMPVSWRVTDYEEDSLSNATSWGYDSVIDAQVGTLRDAFDNWQAATCAGISSLYAGVSEGNEGKTNDGNNKMYFDDPLDQSGTGVLAVTQNNTSNEVVDNRDGVVYHRLTDSDITFNDDIDWGLTNEMEASCSGSTISLEAVATHEIGHLWGLGHSCDEGEPCNDSELLEATMYWQTGACDLSEITINEDDINGLNAIYGPFATFTTDSERFGATPLTIDFQIVSDDVSSIQDVEWNFGDGESSSEFNPSHTYAEQGQFTVVMDVTGKNAACGEWDKSFRERAYVTACSPPQPGLSPSGDRYEGLFTFEHITGTQYQMINRSDTSVYGCLDTVVWQVYNQGGDLEQEVTAWSPILEFPSDGTWRVLLNVGGPGGMSAAEITIDTSTDQGCNSVPGRVPGFLVALSSLALGLSRRRRH